MTSPHRRRTLAMLCILPWFLLLMQYLVVLPRYDRLFRDHRIRQGDVGQFLADTGRLAARYPGGAVLIAVAAIAMSVTWVFAADARSIRPRVRKTILSLVFGLPTALFLLTWVGVAMMHRTLIDALER